MKLPGDDEWREIVGVVGSVRHDRLDQDGTGALYVPWMPLASKTEGGLTDMFLIVKASGEVADLIPKIRAAVLALDPDQPIGNVATMESLIRASYAPRRLNSSLLASFSLVALALAAIGSYGVLSYTVSQRTHDIGIRVALGATRRHIIGQIVGEGFGMALIGAVLGLGGAVLSARLLRPLLFDVSPYDLSTYAFVLLSFLFVALLATVRPASRAARIDPAAALRWE